LLGGYRTFCLAISILIPQGHKFRLSRQAAQLSFIPQGHKFRLSRQAAQLSFIASLSPVGWLTIFEDGVALCRFFLF
jgi:hypothetical protein